MTLSRKLNENIFYYDGARNLYNNRHDLLASEFSTLKRFYYYDKEFSQVNWTKEPVEDLWTLYSMRAQQIRDDFDYVILCYSGGVDSTTILEAFYYNNIYIDEILLVGAFSQDKFQGDDTNHNADLYYNVHPTLRSMNLPNTKITVKDYTEYFNDPNNFSLIKEYGDDFALMLGAYTSVHNLFWYDLKKFIGADKTKNTCYIMGSDKPKLSYEAHTNRFYTDMNDASVADYGAAFVDENFTRVNFYTEPKAEAIMRKQLHTLLKFYIQNINIDKTMTHDNFQQHYINIVNGLMYNLRNPLKYKSKKSVISCLSVRDMFMLESQDSDMFKIYKQATLKLDKRVAYLRRGIQTQKYYVTESA
jgi:hypothetical protein